METTQRLNELTSEQAGRTFVLIPGAGGSAWYWHRVLPLLQQHGHAAIAVDLPGDDPEAGLHEYADLVTTAASGHEAVVLVAQSLGGFTAPLAALKAGASMLVFVNAMIPAQAETPGEWWDNTGWAQARASAAQRRGYGSDFDLDVYFLHDVPPDVAAAGAPYQRPEADVAFGSPCDFAEWPDIPVRVVAGADDRFFPLAFQQAVAQDRLDIEPDVLPGGHLIALSQPGALARYLLAAVTELK